MITNGESSSASSSNNNNNNNRTSILAIFLLSSFILFRETSLYNTNTIRGATGPTITKQHATITIIDKEDEGQWIGQNNDFLNGSFVNSDSSVIDEEDVDYTYDDDMLDDDKEETEAMDMDDANDNEHANNEQQSTKEQQKTNNSQLSPPTTNTTATSIIESSSPTSSIHQNNVINYNLQNTKFIETISNCIIDQNTTCHIHYLHTSKTGGTTIESEFQKIFQLDKIKSCCGSLFLREFNGNRKMYCMKPFVSLTYSAMEFMRTALYPCREIYDIDEQQQQQQQKETKKHRIIILATFREPYGKALSQIHQGCNKNPNARTKEFLDMCKRCDYNQDQKDWDEQFVSGTNFEYLSIYNDLILGTRNDLGGGGDDDGSGGGVYSISSNIPVLTIDLLDISSFFEKLGKVLPSDYASRLKEDDSDTNQYKVSGTVYNKESLEVCDFGFRSAMMRGLQPSLEVYRNLTLGW